MPNEAQTQYGLPFQRLPGAAGAAGEMTPELVINEQTRIGRQEIQQRFTLAWDEINRSARFIGRVKASNMRRELHTKAKQEMLLFNQKAKAQADQLDRINRLAEIGVITNPDEIKARMVFGADVARSMYPKPERERTIPQQFGELDVYSHRISQELENFRSEKPSKFLSRLKAISPLATMTSILRGPPAITEKDLKLQTWDPVAGEWKKSKPEEVVRYIALLQEEKAIIQRKTELLGQPDIARRRVQPGIKGGTFSDKIAESVRPQQQRPAAKPKVIRQRNTRTGQERISYDGGRTWQMTG